MNKERIFENVLRETRQYVCLDKFPLLEDKVSRLINKHAQNGFAIVSACRDSLSKKENLERTEQLKNLLIEMGWSYTICYGGGFIEKEVIEDGDEIALIVGINIFVGKLHKKSDKDKTIKNNSLVLLELERENEGTMKYLNTSYENKCKGLKGMLNINYVDLQNKDFCFYFMIIKI